MLSSWRWVALVCLQPVSNVAELAPSQYRPVVNPRRKQLKRFHEPGDCHELTFSTFRQQELLTRDDWRGMLCRSIDRAIENHKYRLISFVLMLDHVHLLVLPTEIRPGNFPIWTSCSRRSNARSLFASNRC
jgi:hypothetical protein